MIWPDNLAVLYPYPGTFSGWQLTAALIILIGISFLAIRYLKIFPWLGVGWFWYLGTLVPVIGLVQVGVQAWADRYTYIPLIGLFIIFAWGVPEGRHFYLMCSFVSDLDDHHMDTGKLLAKQP
jgi:uncharacterized membrane protein